MGAALLLLFSGACASTNEAKRPEASTPCAPADCPPCDETKQKCMGPMVCDGHPERAKRICARDADGQCRSKLVCNGGP